MECARDDGPQLLVLAADSRAELLDRLAELRELLESGGLAEGLSELARRLNVPLPRGEFRLALVASSAAEIQKRIRFAADRLADPAKRAITAAQGVYYAEPESRITGQLAFLFPGEGSQYPGMLHDLYRSFPEVRAAIQEMDVVSAQTGGALPLRTVLFPPEDAGAEQRSAAEARLWEMEYAVPAVLAADLALYRLLTRLGIRPDALLGHSTGEFAALMLSGAIEVGKSDWATFAREFASIPTRVGADAVPPTTLFAIGAAAEVVSELAGDLGDGVKLGMDNCPHQAVLVATEPLAATVLERLRARGLIFERLRFDRPYHTALFGPFAPHLSEFFARWITAPPRVPTYSCTSTAPLPDDVGEIRELAVQHWIRPVRFHETIERMYADGVRIFVEVGARGNLTGFVGNILGGRPHLALPADVTHRPGRLQLCHLLGVLVAHQLPVELDCLYPESPPRPGALACDANALISASPTLQESVNMDLSLPTSPAESPSLMHSSPAPQAPAGVLPVPGNSREQSDHARGPVPRSDPPAAEAVARVMAGHLNLMSQFLAVQREVMGRFLAATSGQGLGAGESPALLDNTAEIAVLGAPAAPQSLAEPAPRAAVRPPAAEVGVAPAAAAPVVVQPERDAPPRAELSAEALTQALLSLVSERTGYPVEMLDLNLDLEADLGIDSIKRVEILSSLQQQTKSLAAADMETLSARRTLGEIIELLHCGEARRTA